MHASIQKRIPESRRMAGMGVGNRRCLKVPIFADAVWAKRCCRRCSEPGGTQEVTTWHYGCHVTSLFTLSPCLWSDSDRIVSQHPWSLASRVTTLGTSGDLWSQALGKPYFKCWWVQTGVTSCLRLYISFPSASPAAIPGCGLAPLLVRRASLPGAGGLPAAGTPSTLSASHLTLSFLSP